MQSRRVRRCRAESTVLVATSAPPDEGALERLRARYRKVDAEVVDVNGDGEPILHGVAYGPDGPATDDELLGAVHSPAARRALRGHFVLAAEGRLLTSPDVTQALKVAEGPGGRAWATKGSAALALAGVTPQLHLDAIAEFVLFDFVLDDEELLRGVRLVEEASCVDLATGATSSWWPREERLAAGPPTAASDLRTVLASTLRPVAADPTLRFGLTAGRDSTLVADAIASGEGPRVQSFTIGHPDWPDAVGAAAIARRLGWAHEVVGDFKPGAVSFAGAVRWTAWTDGLCFGRDLIGPGLSWNWEPGVSLSGSGGEIGRAFWWPNQAAADVLAEPAALNPSAPLVRSAVLAERFACAIDGVTQPGRVDGGARLDLLYALGRMRSWLGRSRPNPAVNGTVAAYLDPDVVRLLLDLPAELRSGARGFDAALAQCDPDLRAISASAIATHRRRRSLVTRVRNRWSTPTNTDLGRLRQALAEASTWLEPVRDALGTPWWDDAVATAPTSTRARISLWNAVAVAALHARLESGDADG
jgi:hypothetical protein